MRPSEFVSGGLLFAMQSNVNFHINEYDFDFRVYDNFVTS